MAVVLAIIVIGRNEGNVLGRVSHQLSAVMQSLSMLILARPIAVSILRTRFTRSSFNWTCQRPLQQQGHGTRASPRFVTRLAFRGSFNSSTATVNLSLVGYKRQWRS